MQRFWHPCSPWRSPPRSASASCSFPFYIKLRTLGGCETMTERREYSHTTAVAHVTTHMGTMDALASLPSQRATEGKLSTQRTSSRRTAHRWWVLAFLLVSVTLGMLTSLLFMASDCEPAHMMNTLRTLSEHLSSHALIMGGSTIAVIGISMAGAFIWLGCSFVHTLIRPPKHEQFFPLQPLLLVLPWWPIAPLPHTGARLRWPFSRPFIFHPPHSPWP